VLFVGTGAKEAMSGTFAKWEVIESGLFDQFAFSWLFRKGFQHIARRDPLLQSFMRKHRIDVLSHSDFLGLRADIPSICWIGDFQHVKLPEFFKRSELIYRNRDFHLQCDNANLLLLSSHDAQKELATFHPSSLVRSRVLQFVAGTEVDDSTPNIGYLAKEYSIVEPYFHVPNQFWAHKNHSLILRALRRLKDEGRSVTVIATGSTEDYRRPDYFGELMSEVERLGVTDQFKVLGIIPYHDLVGLMANSVALLNPSRYEGWSTSVEEAKSLGKRIIVSDIPVHREQAPSGGVYVGCDDDVGLAEAMSLVMSEHEEEQDQLRMMTARADLPRRTREFAQRYQTIVMEAVESG
jgi:glycosyltransferase involved in cell wall biosynthesis